MLQCIHLPLLHMHAAVDFNKSVEVQAAGFRRASRSAGKMAVKVAQNDVRKRFSTKKWLRFELLSTQPLHICL